MHIISLHFALHFMAHSFAFVYLCAIILLKMLLNCLVNYLLESRSEMSTGKLFLQCNFARVILYTMLNRERKPSCLLHNWWHWCVPITCSVMCRVSHVPFSFQYKERSTLIQQRGLVFTLSYFNKSSDPSQTL